MNDCAVPRCTGPARSGQLMCRSHWFDVPAEIRRMVNKTWRAYSTAASTGAPAVFAAARDAYRQARTAAVEAVTP